MPQIGKYKYKFRTEILCGALWGVNLLIGTENGLFLLDRSGNGKVFTMVSRRRFEQIDVLEGINVLTSISGKTNKLRVYYLSWLKNKIVKGDEADKNKLRGYVTVGEFDGCTHYKVVNFHRIKFLSIAVQDRIEVYAWAPKPYHKFMAFKSFTNLVPRPVSVNMTVESDQSRLKVIYASESVAVERSMNSPADRSYRASKRQCDHVAVNPVEISLFIQLTVKEKHGGEYNLGLILNLILKAGRSHNFNPRTIISRPKYTQLRC
ncbi:mitogen-activated kinase kinase kinase kinase 4-like, partial [Paramuricea clavata]